MKKKLHFLTRLLGKDLFYYTSDTQILRYSDTLITLILVFSLSFTAQANIQYKVKSGDSASVILNNHNLRPIYGRHGSLNSLIELNPNLVSSKANLIYPDQVLALPSNKEFNQVKSQKLAHKSDQETQQEEVLSQQPQDMQQAEQTETNEINRDLADLMSSRYPKSLIQMSLLAQYLRIDGTVNSLNKDILVLSDLNLGAQLGYLVNWNKNLQTGLSFSYLGYSVKELNPGYSFTELKGQLWGFGLELGYFFTDRLRPYLGYSLQEQIFVKSVSATEFSFDEIFIAAPYMGIDYTFLNRGRFSLGSGINYRHLQSEKNSDYEVSSGNRLGAYIYLIEGMRSNRELGLKLKIGYEEGSQNSSLVDQKNKKVYFNVGMDWGL